MTEAHATITLIVNDGRPIVNCVRAVSTARIVLRLLVLHRHYREDPLRAPVRVVETDASLMFIV